MVLSYSGGTNAPEVASELARFCAFMQTEGVNFVGYAITWDRRGVHGKTAFLGKVGAQVLVDDDFLTGREAEQSGCKFIRSRASTIDWALELQHFAATTKGWYVKQSHTARVLGRASGSPADYSLKGAAVRRPRASAEGQRNAPTLTERGCQRRPSV